MILEAFLLAAATVTLEDSLRRFPSAMTATEQTWRYRTHGHRLRFYRAVHGWSDGFWDAALAENEFGLYYWLLLEDARWGAQGQGFGPVWRVRRLEALRRLIGPERFRAGWHPLLYPACLRDAPYWGPEE